MKIIRMRTLTVLGLAGLMGAALFYTSQSVQEAEEKLAVLKSDYAQEMESIRLLNTEWAFLNNPQRLETLSKKYLDLVPPQPNTMVSAPDELPVKDQDAMESPAETSVQGPPPQGLQPAVFKAPLPRAKPAFASSFPFPSPSPSAASPAKSNSPRKNRDSLLRQLSRERN